MSDPVPLYETTEAPVPPGAEAAWLTARDGVRLRVALYPAANPRGSVVLSPGRTEPIEKYHEVIGELVSRGFTVLAHDWRGQGLSDRLAADDRRKGCANGWRPFLDDFSRILSAYQARLPRPWIAMGHSMGGGLTLLALAFVDAAKHFPGINSYVDDAANEVVVMRNVNLGFAADTPRGLVVPNVKSADQLDLRGMAVALAELIEKARAGTLSPADMAGTTMTITNVGPFGIDTAVAILPPGTGAILCVGQIAKAPWVVNDEIVVRQVVEISMTFDHRQIDGALASAVLAHVGNYLTNPPTSLRA